MLRELTRKLGAALFRREPEGPGDSLEMDALTAAAMGGASASMPGWDDLIRRIQDERGSHVIGLIHRHIDMHDSWESWFFDAMIGEHHLQDFMAAMGSVPEGAPLDIVLHSIGGFALPVMQIARAIRGHSGPVTVFVPHYAHGMSTLVALSGASLVMGSAASLSWQEMPDRNLETVIRQKGARRTQDMTLLRQHNARLFANELRDLIAEIAPLGSPRTRRRLARNLTGSRYSRWDPLTAPQARSLGLPVTIGMESVFYDLIHACRFAPTRDNGIKTAPRAISQGRTNRMMPGDIEMLLAQGIRITPDSWQGDRRTQDAPRNFHDDSEDDPHGVSLEHCDITIRPLIAQMEKARGTRVVCIIHQMGMESSSVDTVTTEDILTALQATPPDTPLDIILHTPGGYSYEAHQIAMAVKAHRGRKTVFVPHFAMSGGTIIALAADEIVLAPHAVLGPIDSQFPVQHLRRMMPTRAIIDLVRRKPKKRVHDELLELALECRRTLDHDHRNAMALMRGTYSEPTAERIAHELNDGIYTHGFPVTCSHAKRLGLNVSSGIPPEVLAIIRAFRRQRFGKRSVIYCP